MDGGVLLYTNKPNGEFTLKIVSEANSSLKTTKTFDASQGKETKIKDYRFGTAADIPVWWKFDASPDRSSQFKVVALPTLKPTKLEVQPA
ncbi:MAG: hypothetical protein ACLQIB_20935 [Isosphaeraceae bacterium]